MDNITFKKFSYLIYSKSGIVLGSKKESLVSSRIAKRMHKLGIQSCSDYYEFVQTDASGKELVNLINSITTNVTSFFREENHFSFLADAAKRMYQDGKRSFRIWSAASSTGEEPYSIAITMAEALKHTGHDIKIMASDISTKVLEKAKAGIYERERFTAMQPKIRMSYFSQVQQDGILYYQVRKELQDMVTFVWLNLVETPYPMHGPFDFIFIRNVMIYFDNSIRKKLMGEAYRLLENGGYLIVGHSESMAGSLEERFLRIMPAVYRKEQ